MFRLVLAVFIASVAGVSTGAGADDAIHGRVYPAVPSDAAAVRQSDSRDVILYGPDGVPPGAMSPAAVPRVNSTAVRLDGAQKSSPANWVTTDWTECSSACGPGTREREVSCQATACPEAMPATQEACFGTECECAHGQFINGAPCVHGLVPGDTMDRQATPCSLAEVQWQGQGGERCIALGVLRGKHGHNATVADMHGNGSIELRCMAGEWKAIAGSCRRSAERFCAAQVLSWDVRVFGACNATVPALAVGRYVRKCSGNNHQTPFDCDAAVVCEASGRYRQGHVSQCASRAR